MEDEVTERGEGLLARNDSRVLGAASRLTFEDSGDGSAEDSIIFRRRVRIRRGSADGLREGTKRGESDLALE